MDLQDLPSNACIFLTAWRCHKVDLPMCNTSMVVDLMTGRLSIEGLG